MLEQSDAVKQAWQASDRTLDIVINVNGTDYRATSINSLSYDAGAFTGDSLGIGSTYENSVSVEFSSVIEAFEAGQVVKPQIGIEVNGDFEYTPLGVFIISEVNRDRNNNLTTIKALDQMVKLERDYTSTLTYPAAMLDVVAEIASQGGVTVNQTDLAHLPNLPKLNSAITGQTLRTAIGWIAQFYAGFAAFDRSGQLTIRTTATPDYVINPSEYMQGGLTKNEVTYQTGGIKVSVTTTSATETGEQEDKTTTLQAGETSGSQIELTNNVMTNDALSTIWTSIKDVSFYPYSLNWFGNPALEAGDWVTLTDTQGNKFNVPVNQLTFTFNGGLESTINANQASQSSTVIPWTGPTQNAINQAITRKMATGNNVYDPSFTDEPKNAKIGDVWFKQNGNNVELWTYSRDSSGNASWQKQEVDGEVKAQVDEAKKLAIEAQTTADGKNSVYRGSDPNTVPTAGLKDGDLYFTDNALYTWTGTSWEETISDTTGAEIKAKVDEAIAEAKNASETADAKNKVYRVKDVSVIPTANLKTGDICFTDNAVYTWTGSAWEETVSDTTGAEIKSKVDQVAQESQKGVADLTSNVESKVKDLDTSIQSTQTSLTAATNKVASDLSETKSDLATVASDLSTTKNNLADTGNKLATAVSDFQKKTDQLSGSLETANSKIEFNSNSISEVKQTADKISTTVADQSGKISQLQQDSSGLTSRVGSAEGNISQLQQTASGLTSTVSNLKAGDRNYIRGTSAEWSDLTNFNNTANYCLQIGTFYPGDLKEGDQITLGITLKNTGITSGKMFLFQGCGDVSGWTFGVNDGYGDIASLVPTNQTAEIRMVKTLSASDVSNNTIQLQIRTDNVPAGGTLSAKCVYIKRGTLATDWSPAPEDVDSSISQIKQTADKIQAQVDDNKGNISSITQTANAVKTDLADAKGNISQLQQTADRIKFSMAGQGLDLIDGLDGELVMGSGIPNTTWNGPNACLTLPTTPIAQANGEVLPQNGTAFAMYYNWEAGKTYTQSIIIETDAQINTSVQPQWTWFTIAGGHNAQSAELINLGNNCYRLIGSYTPSSNNAKEGVRILDIWNFTSFVNVTTGTYLKFRSPHFFCADDNSLSELKITANGITAYVKASKGSDTLASLLSMDPNNSTIAQVVNGKPIAAINLSSEGDVTIDGKKLHITASTTIDDASIGSAKIASLSADKITAGTLDASVVTVKNINADNISAGTLAAEHLHVTKDTVIDSGVIGNAQISNLSADKITAGTLDASQIRVINLDANSITTGSLSAAVIRASGFENYTVSPSNPFDFDKVKSTYANWFLVGETTTADHVYNGPKDASNNKLTPFMYVTSRGNPDGNRFTITVWKDDDPTQYQRIWTGDHWTDWVILPNSQNLISAINISPDSVMIAGKKITLDGDVTIDGTDFASKLKATGITVDQLVAGNIDASKINVINLNANNITAGTINGNNLSINLDNGQVAFTRGSLHSTDGMFNIDLDNKSFKIQTNNGVGLFVDDNGFHYKADSTSDLWINKDGFHSYTDGNQNGTWIKDDSLTNADAIGQGVTFQKGNIQFSSLPYWSNDSSKVYGTISRDDDLFSASKDGLRITGRDGVTISSDSCDANSLLTNTYGPLVFHAGSGLGLSDDVNRASCLYSNSTLYLSAGPRYPQDSSQPSGLDAQPTIAVGTGEYYSHSGAWMSIPSDHDNRGNSVSVHAANFNVTARDWINFEAQGSDARIAFQANYIHMYPTYLKTTSAGANVYVAADGALLRSTSARKYKTDIQPANEFADYGDKLISLTPKVWLDKAEVKRYKDDPDKNKKPGYYYGLIADELDQAGLNKLVTYGADGQVEGIQYDRLAVALLPIVKKLKEEVQELKERISK